MFSIKKFFCKIGIHWMKNHHSLFWDAIGGIPVFAADCECGKKWMVQTTSPINILSTKIEA